MDKDSKILFEKYSVTKAAELKTLKENAATDLLKMPFKALRDYLIKLSDEKKLEGFLKATPQDVKKVIADRLANSTEDGENTTAATKKDTTALKTSEVEGDEPASSEKDVKPPTTGNKQNIPVNFNKKSTTPFTVDMHKRIPITPELFKKK